jgi:hypothetical protein
MGVVALDQALAPIENCLSLADEVLADDERV